MTDFAQVFLTVGMVTALVILTAVLGLYMVALLSMIFTNAHLVHIRYFSESERGLSALQMEHKVDKERTDPIWMEYTGNGKRKDLRTNGFALEYFDGSEKVNLLFSHLEDFENKVESDRDYHDPDYEGCWRCGEKTSRRNAMKASKSRIYRLKWIDFTLTYEGPAYICKSCQRNWYKQLIDTADLTSKEDVLARKV